MQKLAWKGLAEKRGGDALAFAQAFDIDQNDYSRLGELYDLFEDTQQAACVWLKENTAKWERWVKFPERERQPFLCTFKIAANGICGPSYDTQLV